VKAYDSGRREVFYSILIEFGIHLKLVRLIKTCLKEIYSKVHIGKCLLSFCSEFFVFLFPLKAFKDENIQNRNFTSCFV